MRPFSRFLPLVVSLSLSLANLASGAAITIGDPSFEGNSLGVGDYSNYIGTEWTGTGGNNSGLAFEEYITGFAADGTDHLGMELGHDVWQTRSATYQSNTRYTLTVAVGNRSGNSASGNQSQYFLTDNNTNIYASGNYDAYANVPAGTFADAPALVLDTSVTPAAVGKRIRILLRARGAGRSHFDNIRLDATPVTPSTATVTGLAASSVTATTATLGGTVSNIGVAAPTITVYWGQTDGGTNPLAWTSNTTLPGTYSGAFSTPITGLNPYTTYRFTVKATNSAGDSWVSPSVAFTTPAQAPAVTTGGASAIGSATATLAANVTATGGEDPTVTIYYGTSDGGTNPVAWGGSVSLGQGSGGLSAAVSGLSSSTTYYFRAYAQNSGGSAWAANTGSFTTLTVTLPAVADRGTEGITGTTANLRGEITDTGNAAPVVTLFYGQVDGGTDPLAWTTSAALGNQSGEFARFVTGLNPSTTYFFRWRAVNAAGTTWSPATSTFSTTTLVTPQAIINEFHYNSDDATSLEEFVELHNPGDSAIDVSGWSLADAVTYTIPAGTSIPAGGYLVIAENPATIQAKFGVTGVLGPWTGKLSGDGEEIELRNPGGTKVDSVDYKAGFPWPTAADGAGPSAELINPGLDNNLGGSWRSSGASAVLPETYIAAGATDWKYLKGTDEASDPTDAWRANSFEDAAWSIGQAPIGYKTGNPAYATTTLDDMYNTYTSVYFRRPFNVSANSIPTQLKLRVNVDDGCIVWINGHEVARFQVADGDIPYTGTAANHDRAWQEIIINNADVILYGGTNMIAVHGFNTRIDSSDFSMDLELSNTSGTTGLPTPGRLNTASRGSQSIPPANRQVVHSPNEPKAGEAVTITTRITDPDGMGAVSLSYQLVDPGAYIPLKTVNATSKLQEDNPAYATGWTSVPMVDDGTGGDLSPGDSYYTCVLPGSLQTHRRLVRYKITFADSLGNSQTVPYADDEQPNFAYFVYNGVPAWTGTLRTGATAQTFSGAMQESLPPLHLIATAADVNNCQYVGAYETARFRGTVIQRGVVHDHIEFRVRGIGSTRVSGKNKWNIYFNRARDYQAYDNYGNPYKETWNNLLVNANASPWASVHRGSAGVEEAISHRIFQLAGMAAMNTQFFHLRVIDGAAESGPTQYDGDLWGLYLGLEPTEGNFLDERGLADGNIYSIEQSTGDKKHQAPGQPADSSDWTAFNNAVIASGQSEQWYRDNVDLDALFTFLALNRLIGNVDVRPGDNYRFYHRPTDNRWVIIPYDMDMQFIAAHHWGGGMDQIVNGTSQSVTVAGAPNVIRAISRHEQLALEYRNRCRELLSLMASDGSASGGQIGQLIDEYAQMVNPAGQSLTWADLDAAMWNLHPRTTGTLGTTTGQSSHKGNFFRANYLDGTRGGLGGTTQTGSWIRTLADPDLDDFSDHEGLMQWFTNYATNTWPGGTWNRKAMPGIGNGTDPDANRQLGYGYKYLEFEALYGGWVNCNADPSIPAFTDFPDKPIATYSGDGGYPVNGLRFASSAFSDPNGAGTYAAHEWRVAEIRAPGTGSYTPGTPRKYEIQADYSTGAISGPVATFTLPLGATEPGKTYRVRVRHKDSSGNWSYWSDPVQFAATPAPVVLMHYWNFNDASPAADMLVPTQTIGGAAMAVAGAYESGTGQSFAAANARNGDLAATHLRVNNPLTPGTTVTMAIPTTGHQDIIVKYETRRSGQGAGTQHIAYTLDGTSYTNFATITVVDGTPVVQNLDFRPIPAAHDNPHFGLRITFSQGTGGTGGNNRFDNLTVEGTAIPLTGYAAWQADHFTDPGDLGNPAISGPLANPSGDGISNLLRYAHGVGPQDPVLALLPQLATDAGSRVFRFRYDAGKPDLIWRVRATNDLGSWSSVLFDSTTDPIPPMSNGWLPVQVPLFLGSGPAADDRMFLRLEVIQTVN